MAVKCPRCGEEAESDRFYCGSCGEELQPTSLPEDAKRAPATRVWDIDSRGLTIAVEGIAVSIVGLMVYTFGVYWGTYSGADAWLGWPGIVMTSGFCMIGIGVFMNWSQDLPRGVRLAIGSEIVFGIISLTVCLALIMQVTSSEWVTSSTGGQLYKIPLYGYRPVMLYMIVPLVWCPFLVVWGLWVASRLAWAAAVLLSLVAIPLVILKLPSQAGSASALLAGIQIVLLVTLMTKAVRSFFLKPEMAKKTTPAA